MMIEPAKRIFGTVYLPGDKSISHRAAMLASMAEGRSTIHNFAASADCLSTLECLHSLGTLVEREGSVITITGGNYREPDRALDCGNSGTTMRLLTGLLAGRGSPATLVGDASLSLRPMLRVIGPLTEMGAEIASTDGHAPLVIAGGLSLTGRAHDLSIASAQIKSSILLAGLNAAGRTSVTSPAVSRDHTERMLRWFGVTVDNETETTVSITGGQRLRARSFTVPGDISAAAFFMVAAAAIPGSEIYMPRTGVNPTRRGVIDVMQGLGFEVSLANEHIASGEPVADITVRGGISHLEQKAVLTGAVIANVIDELPILAVLGTQLAGGLEIRDAAELRVKESDRITAIAAGLRLMGATIEEFADGLYVGPSKLSGSRVDTYGDHRIAMALAVAALFADSPSEISGAECVDVSFPGFFETLASVVFSK